MRILSPSILSADFGNLDRDIFMLNESEAQWIHFDVMDGLFVPNISFGFPVLESVKRIATKFLDVHLMIVQPERYIERFAKAGADLITFHIEATEDAHAIINLIKAQGIKVGVSIKPNTPISEVTDLIPSLDLILVMGVEPGFGGQTLFESSLDKVRELRAIIDSCGASTLIEIDGGVSRGNIRTIFDAGVDVAVAGSAVFLADDPKATIVELLNA